MSQVFVINTIGLTGAEILASYLAEYDSINILPGQNFLQNKKNLYRKHDFTNKSQLEIFNVLNADLLRKNGSIWAGPTKNTTSEFQSRYDRLKHQRFFVENQINSADYSNIIENYISSYFKSINYAPSEKSIYGYWGANYCITHLADNLPYKSSSVINLTNTPSVWLANISQKMTWDNSKALAFYIIHNLVIEHYKKNGYKIFQIDLNKLITNKNFCIAKCLNFLDVGSSASDENHLLNQAYLNVDIDYIDKIFDNAKLIHLVYKDYSLYKIAESISEWSNSFLEISHNQDLLEMYIKYWNTTCHTNFDFIGPLEEELLELIKLHVGSTTDFNISYSFYHKFTSFDSDSYLNPKTKLTHYLGSVEDEIVTPCNSYYIRAILAYFNSIVSVFQGQMHSYTSILDSSLWQRINHNKFQPFLTASGLNVELERIKRAIVNLDSQSFF